MFVFEESRRQKEEKFKEEVARLRRPAQNVRQPRQRRTKLKYPITDEEYAYWKQRDLSKLPASEKAKFQEEGALHLYPTNTKCNQHNYNCLKKMVSTASLPVAKCCADNSSDAAESAADQRTGRMPNKLYLAQGQPVLLTRNLWTECGLVNGARGVVKGMLMDESGDKVRWVALVHFPDYSGPAFSRNHPKCVPIGQHKHDFKVCDHTYHDPNPKKLILLGV